jgi:tRNA pseudouridine55 synthase
MTTSGIFNINKPSGPTSRKVVDQVCRVLGTRKVGHAGTLDPLASGVLVVCFGAATRLIEYVQRGRKTYRAVVRLGVRSDTDDAQGTIEPVVGAVAPHESDVRRAVADLIGEVMQLPPRFSAIKKDGARAYKAARRGEEFDLAPRKVSIYKIDILEYSWPLLSLEIECGGGTYIRSIARDLGEALGCGGMIETLERTRIGPFSLDRAVKLSDLTAENWSDLYLPAGVAVAELPWVELDDANGSRVIQGKSVELAERRDLIVDSTKRGDEPIELALFDVRGTLIAIAELDPVSMSARPRRVFASAEKEANEDRRTTRADQNQSRLD